MPTYEYECGACGRRFEKFEPMTAKPSRTCQWCHKRRARRRISAGSGFIFKGAGFYSVDYAKKPKEKKGKEKGE